MAAMPLDRVRARLDRAINGLLIVVGIQFLLGMWLNLFGSFPTGAGNVGTALTDAADPVLIAHIVFGILLIAGGVAIVLLAWMDALRTIRWYALAGLASNLVAALAGSEFVYSGYSSNAASFLMAAGFAAAVTAYYEGLVRLRAAPLPSAPTSASSAPA
jgi:hypothetical protein